MPDTNEITTKLLALAAKRFKREVSELNATDDFFEKLGIDSFQAMELLTDVEDAFDIEIPDYELNGVTTFAALVTVIERRL
jgi:acyl carrier protein